MECFKKLVSLILFVMFTAMASAQTSPVNGWLMTVNTYKLKNSKFSAYFDAQFRSTDKLKNFQTIILRPGLQYNINSAFNVMVGYAYVPGRRSLNSVTGYLPEHRVWEQVQFMHPVSFTKLNHRLRLEQRFLPVAAVSNNELEVNGNAYANRLRYFFRDIIPVNGALDFKKGLFFALQNEVFINIGDKSVVNGKAFDQNRAYGAVGFRVSPKFDLEAGYLNQYVSGRNKAFTNNHNIQLASYIRL